MAGERIKVVAIVGTRPEIIKMAPVVRELARNTGKFEHKLVTTAQHRQMLDQMLSVFEMVPDIDLELMQHDQNLAEFAARSLTSVYDLLGSLRPDCVLVQGDTTSVMTSALAAFYHGIKIGHVEAGLRSFDNRNPFPEEVNRVVTGRLADLHFAPTERARLNLLKEGIPSEKIFVTGNTVVDALAMVSLDGRFDDESLNAIDVDSKRLLLVTAHRRENHGPPLRSICAALRMLADAFDDLQIVYPVHLSPRVRETVVQELGGFERVHLVEPLSYRDLLRLMSRCYFILTDSGGIQEEAPSFRKPVLVLREVTERPELIEAGAGKVIGTNTDRVFEEASRLLNDAEAYDSMRAGPNPFGDGQAAHRIVSILEAHL